MKKRKNDKTDYISLYGGKNKDFHVRIISEDRLFDASNTLDAKFDEDMHNYGESDDLPNSDKIMVCQQKGIKQESCNLTDNN